MRTDAEKRAEQTRIALAYQESCERARGKRHGVVVTPVEVVDHQVRAAVTAIRQQYGPSTDLTRVKVLDPFGGTGIYLARLMQTVELDANDKIRLAARSLMVEIDATACRMAVDNLRAVMAEETGQCQVVPLVCQADTFTTGDEVWDPAWRLTHLYQDGAAA